jgi:hypothetical protein
MMESNRLYKLHKEYVTLTNALYELEGCCTGGNLHILCDDDNINDDSIAFLTNYIELKKHETSFTQYCIELAILNIMASLDNETDRCYVAYGTYLDITE